MPRQLNKLSSPTIKALTKPGRHSDGGGLYLVVDEEGRKRWVFLFRWRGKLKEMGLGSLRDVPVGKARAKAAAARELVADGVNPIEARKAQRTVPTFGELADQVVADLKPGFRNEKHHAQWEYSLTTLAAPLRPKRVDEITTDDVLAVLKPLWTKTPETASRLRGRIERVLDAARAKGFRSAENPARWRGHLKQLLPTPAKLSRGKHKAMDYPQVPALVRRLRALDGVSACALEFLILTAARSGEVIGARWSEFDLDAKVWTVPASRMKAGREHRVPLTDRAVKIVAAMQKLGRADHVFPGMARGKPLSNMALAQLLRRMKLDDVTVHGFRSAFRDWAGDETSFPRELAEQALAHVIGDKAEQAYRRKDALDRRRELMKAWAAYLDAPPALRAVEG